jgi:hypothetical protein
VIIHHLIVRDTVDELVVAALSEKKVSLNALLAAVRLRYRVAKGAVA